VPPRGGFEARAEGDSWSFRPGEGKGRARLALTREIRKAWEAAGRLEIRGGDFEPIVLRWRPRKWDLGKATGTFLVEQRHTAEIPGFRGWARVVLDDITRGQVLL